MFQGFGQKCFESKKYKFLTQGQDLMASIRSLSKHKAHDQSVQLAGIISLKTTTSFTAKMTSSFHFVGGNLQLICV